MKKKHITRITTVKTNNSGGKDSLIDIKITSAGDTEKFVPNSLKVTDVQIVEDIVSDTTTAHKISFDAFKRCRNNKLQQSVSFYPNTQFISSINGQTGSYAKEILQGIASGLQFVAKIVNTVLTGGGTPLSFSKAAIETETKVDSFKYDVIDTITYTKGYIKTINDSCTLITSEQIRFPLVDSIGHIVKFDSTYRVKVDVEHKACSPDSNDTILNAVYYRTPLLTEYTVKLIGNQDTVTLLKKNILMPQYGKMSSLQVKVKGRNPYASIEFDENGALKKVEMGRDKTPEDMSDNIQKATDASTNLVTDYKYQLLQNQYNYLKLQKDINDLKNPSSTSGENK